MSAKTTPSLTDPQIRELRYWSLPPQARHSPDLMPDANPGRRATTEALIRRGMLVRTDDRDDPVVPTTAGFRLLAALDGRVGG